MIVIGGNIINAQVEDSVVITKEIAPLEDVSSRTGFYSKTFTIVGDTEAHKTFNHLFDTNITIQNTSTENFNPDFNPNLKASFQFWEDDLVVFQGFCKLDNITIEDEMVKYHLTAFGGAGEFFEEVGESRLEDLDMSAYNHSFTRANVVASWSNDYTDGYVYPMIDYGHKYQRNWWSWTEFRPAVFVKAIWDQIFAEAGWSYESTHLSTDHFEKLVIPSPSSSIRRTNSEVNDLTFTVGSSSSFFVTNSRDLYSALPLEFDLDTGVLLSNTLQNTSTTEYDTATYKYTADGKIAVKLRTRFEAQLEYIGSSLLNVGSANVTISVIRERSGTLKKLESFDLGGYFAYSFTATTITTGSTSTQDYILNVTTGEHELEAGDSLFLAFTDVSVSVSNPLNPGSFPSIISGLDGDWQINVSAGSLFGNVVNPNRTGGETIGITQCLPDWTQREFIRNISKMFNLYIEQTGDKTLLIEPRNEGYLQATKVDWTDKLDYSQEYKITPMGELNKKEYHFTYEEDEDVWNTQYTNSWDELYGEKSVYVNNDFQTEVEEIRLDFAPTVLSNSKADNLPNNRVISDMSFYNDDGKPEIQDAKPRILYYGGLVDGTTWTLVNGNQVGAATDVDYGTYPYAGHLDDPITPTYDYLWFFPKTIYYYRAYGSSDYPQYPNRNLYNLYWYQFIEEITSKDSKVLEGWFDISYYDWVNLSFRKLYHFLDADWRLISVSDYDLEKGGLTYCKFLKAGAWVNPTYDRYKINTGYGETDDNGDTLPFVFKPSDTAGNKFPQKYDTGDGNTVNGRVGFVYGDANLVSTGATGFALMNASGNNIQASGAVLFNTDGRDIFKNNEVWFNNINLETYIEVTLDNTLFEALGATPVGVLPDLESNQFYDITRVTTKLEHNGSDYSDGSTVLIRTNITNTNRITVSSSVFTAAGYNYSYDKGLGYNTDVDLGEGIEITVSGAEFSGSGGDVTFKIYYKVIEV